MKILIPGGTGSTGTAVIQDLVRHGHVATGLSRQDTWDRKLAALGARPLGGDLRHTCSRVREIARRHGNDASYVVRSLKHMLIKSGDWAEGPALDQQIDTGNCAG
ncbi:hypothetical protein [Leisingera sp.]|uniref:hypothetical protein n=1 Tax=Leisingera sp. TaxID=1879318 RepID=UPI002B275BB0|nr:hypothetical protein [Leisingera sp.]